MRVEKTKRRRAMRAGTAMLAVSIFCLFALERFDRRMGSPKLVSIEESPDIGEMCVWEPASLNAAATTGGRSPRKPDRAQPSTEDNLFGAFRGSAEAGSAKRRRNGRDEPASAPQHPGYRSDLYIGRRRRHAR